MTTRKVLGFGVGLAALSLAAPAAAQLPNTINFCDFSNLPQLGVLLQANGSATFSSNVL